ncbi:MAG: SDR family NAD(P)-dependent oxidoreductase [Aeromicrobium sp.]
MDLQDVAALVTGAGSGLGAATATALAERGARVFGVDLSQALDAIEPSGSARDITYLAADVTDAGQVRAAVAQAAEAEAPLRILVNCAGIGPTARILGKAGPHNLELFAQVIRVNLVGTFTMLEMAAEKIAQTSADLNGQRGVIVNTASIAAFDGQVGQAAYASSKAGVVGLTLPAARDLAQYGIRVMTIAPGIVQTPMLMTVSEKFRAGLADAVPFPKRLAEPNEYAKLVLSIIDNDYLNGETIRMDGAMRMPPR